MDLFVFEKLNNFVGSNYSFDLVAVFFAGYAGYILVAVVLLLWFLKKDAATRRLILLAMASAVAARFVVVELIRFFYSRPRPFEVLDIIQLIRHGSGHSFPSGHAAFYFALSTGVYLYNKKIGIAFLITSALIGLARIYAGLHWPSDILVGAAIGIAVAISIRKLFKAAIVVQ